VPLPQPVLEALRGMWPIHRNRRWLFPRAGTGPVTYDVLARTLAAAARAAGTTYSRFMEGLKAAKVALDRKILADIAATDNAAFSELVKVAQDALKTKAAKA